MRRDGYYVYLNRRLAARKESCEKFIIFVRGSASEQDDEECRDVISVASPNTHILGISTHLLFIMIKIYDGQAKSCD